MALSSTSDPAVFDVGIYDQVVIMTENGEATDATVEIGIIIPPDQPNPARLTPNYDPDGGTTVGAATTQWRTVEGTITDSDHGRLFQTPCNFIRVSGHGEGNGVYVHGRERSL